MLVHQRENLILEQEKHKALMFHVFHVLNLYKLIITLIPKNNIKNAIVY